MNNRTMKNRLKQIRDSMSNLKLDCLVVTKPANVTYLTGFTGDDSWAVVLSALPKASETSPKGGSGSVILVTDSRYTEQARQECRLRRIVNRTGSMVKTVARILRNRKEKIAVEKTMSIAEFEALKRELTGRIRSVANVVENVRRKKDDGEVAAICAAAEIARRAFEAMKRKIRKGITENELAGILDFEIRKLGGRNAFETIAAFGANASRPHHQPTTRQLSRNDTVLIDFGVRYDGHCCDITRCFEVGKAGPFFHRVYAAVEQARVAALKMVRAGAEISEVDAAAKEVIRKSGLPVYGHGTGHGLGLEVHELPSVSNRTKGKLQAGDVITIEPGVYVPDRLGVRIEDDVLVTDGGYLVLSDGSNRAKKSK